MKYKKKPIIIEAFQMTEERRRNNSEWPNWLHQAWNKPHGEGAVWCEDYPNSNGTDRLVIGTLEGIYIVSWDDWIIRGIKGDLYGCKPYIFEITYEEVWEDKVKNGILAEAIEIANRSTIKLPTYAHIDALYTAWQRSEPFGWEYIGYTRKEPFLQYRSGPCTGLTSTCPCFLCEKVRADDRQDRMDQGEEEI